MTNDPFFSPLDWYNANKYRLPPEFNIFEHPKVPFVFKWKEIEYKMLPYLRGYGNHFYPEATGNGDTACATEVERAFVHCVFELVEKIYWTVIFSAQGKSVQQITPNEYPLLKTVIANFKMEDDIITPENCPEWLLMIKDETERQMEMAEHNNNVLQRIKQRREFIDTVQPIMIEALPGILNIQGEWWVYYEYAYASEFDNLHDWLNRLAYMVSSGMPIRPCRLT